MISNISSTLLNKGGIYKITNSRDDRVYIGSTNNFKKRYKDHARKLHKNTHANKYLQSFYNKYGGDIMNFEILSVCKNSCLLYSEQYFTGLYKPAFNIKKIIERKYFPDEAEYDFNKNKMITINFIDTMIDDYTNN